MDTNALMERFHDVLVDEIRRSRPEYLDSAFTVAEIYQNLVPYRTHRDRLGVEMNGDYEDVLLRLLAGEGDYLVLDSEAARRRLRAEIERPNPDTGLFRQFAAVDVELHPARRAEGAPSGSAPPEAAAEAGGDGRAGGDETSESATDVGSSEAVPEGPPAARNGGRGEGDVDRAADAPAVRSGDGDDDEACRWCRERLPDRMDVHFCPFCGTDVNVVPCPSCGEALEPEWRFCIGCGAEVAVTG